MCPGIHARSPPKRGKATLAVAFPRFDDLPKRGVERGVKKPRCGNGIDDRVRFAGHDDRRPDHDPGNQEDGHQART